MPTTTTIAGSTTASATAATRAGRGAPARRHLAVAVILPTLALAAACGSSSHSGSAAPASTTQSSTAPSSTTPSSTAPTAGSSSPAASTAGASCSLADEIKAYPDTFKTSDITTPSTLKKDYQEVLSVEPKLLSDAPSSLKVPLEKVFQFDNDYFGLFAKYNYDVSDVPPADFESLEASSKALLPYLDEFTAYLTGCGVTFTASPSAAG